MPGGVVAIVILWLLARTAQYLGGPLPLSSLSTQRIIADVVLFAWLLGALSWNYQHG